MVTNELQCCISKLIDINKNKNNKLRLVWFKR